MPVHHRVGDDVVQALELACDQGPVRPRTGIADIEMIPALLRGELGAGLARDPVAERADLTLELARLVAGLDPVGDFGFLVRGLRLKVSIKNIERLLRILTILI